MKSVVVPAIVGQRAGGEHGRYAGPDRAARTWGLRVPLIAGLLMIAVVSLFAPVAKGQNQAATHELVIVYLDHFEAGGKRFDSVEALRKYLEGARAKFSGVDIRECGAQERIREATDAIAAAETKRVVEAGGEAPVAFQMEFASIPCPEK